MIRQLLIEIGENPNREGLVDTPARMAEMYEELFSGYGMNSELDVTFTDAADAIIAKDIGFNSMCEHHMLPLELVGQSHLDEIHDQSILLDGSNIRGCLFLPTI